jgi:hypothetical protein
MSASSNHLRRATKGFTPAKDVANPSTVGIRTVAPSTVGLQSGAKYTPRTQRPAKSGTVQGMKYTGKHLPAVGKFAKTADRVFRGFLAANDARNKIHAARDEGFEVSPELMALCEQAFTAACQAAQQVLAQGNDLVAKVNADKEEQAADMNETVVETGTGEIPHEGARAGALDSGRRAVLDHFASVSSEHVETVDAATRLQMETADWKKHALIRAVADGDEAAAHRIRFGLNRPVSTDPVGDFMKEFASK